MAIRLLFLGRLEDNAGSGEREVDACGSLAELLARLEPGLAQALRADTVRIAVNGTLVADRATRVLRDGDEVAFLPPVSGG